MEAEANTGEEGGKVVMMARSRRVMVRVEEEEEEREEEEGEGVGRRVKALTSASSSV